MLDVSVDSRGVLQALTELRARTPQQAKSALQKIVGDYQRLLTRSRLSGRPGLNRRSGSLARAVTTQVTGTRINDLRGQVGFFDSRAAMIAAVHELGTVGAGGKLPDIVPVRAKRLAWPTRAGAKGRITGWRTALKVAIPPRLEFFSTWRRPFVQSMIRRRLDEAAAKAAGGERRA